MRGELKPAMIRNEGVKVMNRNEGNGKGEGSHDLNSTRKITISPKKVCVASKVEREKKGKKPGKMQTWYRDKRKWTRLGGMGSI